MTSVASAHASLSKLTLPLLQKLNPFWSRQPRDKYGRWSAGLVSPGDSPITNPKAPAPEPGAGSTAAATAAGARHIESNAPPSSKAGIEAPAPQPAAGAQIVPQAGAGAAPAQPQPAAGAEPQAGNALPAEQAPTAAKPDYSAANEAAKGWKEASERRLAAQSDLKEQFGDRAVEAANILLQGPFPDTARAYGGADRALAASRATLESMGLTPEHPAMRSYIDAHEAEQEAGRAMIEENRRAFGAPRSTVMVPSQGGKPEPVSGALPPGTPEETSEARAHDNDRLKERLAASEAPVSDDPEAPADRTGHLEVPGTPNHALISALSAGSMKYPAHLNPEIAEAKRRWHSINRDLPFSERAPARSNFVAQMREHPESAGIARGLMAFPGRGEEVAESRALAHSMIGVKPETNVSPVLGLYNLSLPKEIPPQAEEHETSVPKAPKYETADLSKPFAGDAEDPGVLQAALWAWDKGKQHIVSNVLADNPTFMHQIAQTKYHIPSLAGTAARVLSHYTGSPYKVTTSRRSGISTVVPASGAQA